MPDGSEYVLEYEKTEATTSGMTENKINGEGPDITSAVDSIITVSQRNDNTKLLFAGESALNADNKMLAKAKEMYNDFGCMTR